MNVILFAFFVVMWSFIVIGGILCLYALIPHKYIGALLSKLRWDDVKGPNTIERAIEGSTTRILYSLHEAKDGIKQLKEPVSESYIKSLSKELDEVKKILNEIAYDTSQRFETIEFYLSELKKQEEPIVQQEPVREHNKAIHNDGFFGFPISQTYLRFQNEKTSESFFSAFIKNDEGIYGLLSLGKVKSEDGLENVVKFVGNVRKTDAKDYKVVKYGKVSKVDQGDLWKITSPLIVELR